MVVVTAIMSEREGLVLCPASSQIQRPQHSVLVNFPFFPQSPQPGLGAADLSLGFRHIVLLFYRDFRNPKRVRGLRRPRRRASLRRRGRGPRGDGVGLAPEVGEIEALPVAEGVGEDELVRGGIESDDDGVMAGEGAGPEVVVAEERGDHREARGQTFLERFLARGGAGENVESEARL